MMSTQRFDRFRKTEFQIEFKWFIMHITRVFFTREFFVVSFSSLEKNVFHLQEFFPHKLRMCPINSRCRNFLRPFGEIIWCHVSKRYLPVIIPPSALVVLLQLSSVSQELLKWQLRRFGYLCDLIWTAFAKKATSCGIFLMNFGCSHIGFARLFELWNWSLKFVKKDSIR